MRYERDFIRHLFDYLIAADRAGLEAARAVPDEGYYKDRGFSFGSIHNLLVHQMVAPKTWLRRWQQDSSSRLEDHTDHPTRQDLEERWPRVHQDLLAFLGQQTEHSLNAPMTVRRADGELITLPLGAMMMHVADHGTYHRGQLASMLKLAGAKPIYLPYFRYALQAPG